MEWLEEELPHVLFGLIVTPYILKQLKEKQNVEKIFSFLEEMAISENEEVHGVLVVSVLESIIIEKEIINFFKI